jgi:Outer membrane protein beta-barrel domain
MTREEKKCFRKIFILIVLVVLGMGAKGQTLNIGMTGGVNASQVEGDSYMGFNKLGLTGGFFVNRLIDYNIYWQAEIKYGTRGVYKGPAENDPTLYRSGYHYVEVPVSVHYLYQEKFLVEMGTSPEVLVATYFWDEGGLLDPSTYPENRTFGLSVFAGVAYRFSDRVMAGLRYTNSAFPFRDPEEWNHPRYRGYFHNVICLSMSYRFNQK